MKSEILDKINSLEELKALPESDIPKLCDELRSFLVEKVEKSGGHLASNLGVTELTVAIHRVFDSPKDHIIFDVGHQAYVHKILTDRKDRFDELRTPGGLSGFTLMRESEHDAFGAGHSSTSISAALGYAEAAALNGTDEHSVCVIGDGAYTGGMAHEALNNCRPDLKLVIILNENGMSISSNKGAFANYLSKARTSRKYNKWKRETSSFLYNIPVVGKPIMRMLSFLKNTFKEYLMHPNYFEDLGLYYIGPIDGNDYKKVASALQRAKEADKCVVVHVKTVKGKGYVPAENAPTEFHSIKGNGNQRSTFHGVFVDTLIEKAKNDRKIVAVTAAMGVGTGLDCFGEKFPDRYFDVGIAEEHALTFSAGLAAAGYKPYVAIYSTFLQRGYDNIVHDIALQDLPVRIMIDRAGISSSDGATHHGIFDVAFLSHIPSVELYAPASFSSFSRLLDSDSSPHPVAIRYPNKSEICDVDSGFYEAFSASSPLIRVDFDLSTVPQIVFITYGSILSEVKKAKDMLASEGRGVGIILVEKIKPYKDACEKIFEIVSQSYHIVYVEEGIKNGGAAMITENLLFEMGLDTSKVSYDIIAIDDNFAAPESIVDIYDYVGLSAKKIFEKCKNIINLT